MRQSALHGGFLRHWEGQKSVECIRRGSLRAQRQRV
jgi:hypothetical protein